MRQVAVAEVAGAKELDVTNLAGRKLGESEKGQAGVRDLPVRLGTTKSRKEKLA